MAIDRERLFAEFRASAPAPEESIRLFEQQFGVRLPADYVDFLCGSDGGEGFVGPNYLILWRIEQLWELNEAYEVAHFAPGLLLFGSDGGGEAFAFDTRTQDMPVVFVPFVGLELAVARQVAPNFSSFLEELFTHQLFNE